MVPSPTQTDLLTVLRSFLMSVLPAGVEVIQAQAMPRDQHYAYVHADPSGVPFYVGKGSGRRALRVRNRNRNKFHQDLVGHYEADKIVIGLILCDGAEPAFQLEREMIAGLRNQGLRLANFNDGGEGGRNPSFETRCRMSAAKKGKTCTQDTRDRISKALTGRKQSPEHVAKVTVAMRAIGHRPSMEAKAKSIAVLRGQKQSLETIAKRAAANRGKKRSPEFCARMSVIAKARVKAGTSNFGRQLQ